LTPFIDIKPFVIQMIHIIRVE